MERIQNFIRMGLEDESSTIFSRTTNFLAFATLVSVCATAGEGIPLFNTYQQVFIFIEWFVVGLFTLEYILRIWIAERKLGYIFSYLGLFDLASILPTYLGLRNLSYLKTARIVRTMRFVRFIGRTNVSYVRKKGEEFVEYFKIEFSTMVGALALSLGVFIISYHSIEQDIFSWSEVFASSKVFIGLAPVFETVGLLSACILVLGRVFAALCLGFIIGYGIERTRKK